MTEQPRDRVETGPDDAEHEQQDRPAESDPASAPAAQPREGGPDLTA